jgi:2-C-methyl-D-erythritol 4-phosphate cytidylyltransferase
MKYKNLVIIPSGGVGKRFGGQIPKQYHNLVNLPIIVHCLLEFQKSDLIDAIIIGIAEEYKEFIQEYIDKYQIDKVIALVNAGKERQNTVYNCLMTDFAKNSKNILVHDAVRPFVNQNLINNLVKELSISKAVCPGIKPKSTIRQVKDNDFADKTIDRDFLREIQTPQAFDSKLIIDAYTKADADNFLGTDSASLVERLGLPVKVIDGYEENIKITTPYDFKISEFLIKSNK